MTTTKSPKRMTLKWDTFIKRSLERPKLGQWSDMCLAPVDTYVLVACHAQAYYSFYEGTAIAVCMQRPRMGDKKMEYDWYMVGKTDRDSVFTYTKCNPHWWMPLPMAPPVKPRGKS